jgi:hypothetical protein
MPTITFQISMAPDATSYPLPMNKDHATYKAEVAMQRVSWLPSLLLGNRELKDGATFSVDGDRAIYLRDLVNNGAITFLTIVTTVP